MKTNDENIREKRIEKRDLIIDIAAKLFSELGYHEVNMEMVAKEAGIAKGTIYNYFDSKEDLYFTINEVKLGKLLSELEKKIKLQESVIDDLRGFVIHIFMFLLKYKDFFLIFQRTRLKKQKLKSVVLENRISQLKDMLMNILKEGIEKKVFKNINPCFQADMILGMIYSAVLRNINKNIHDLDIVNEREILFQFIRESVIASLSYTPPLDGKTILITRLLGQSEGSFAEIISAGAEVIALPVLKIVPPSSWKECDEAIKNLDDFDYIIFTSQNAVDWFINRVKFFEKFDSLKYKKIISIGPKTSQKVKQLGLEIFFSPKSFNSIDLSEDLMDIIKKGEKVLIPQSEIGKDTIEINLKEKGIEVHRVPVYTVNTPELEDVVDEIRKINENEIDIFVFTSPSAFNNFNKLMRIENPEEFYKNKVIASIGPVTTVHIKKHNVNISIEPEESTTEGLAKAILNYFVKK